MTNIVESSGQAREKLAAALSLLQSPEAGSLIDSVAAPVARAMGALHAIENSGGSEAAAKAPVALEAVRVALEALQAATPSEASEKATEYIAGSLGLVHGLAEEAGKAPTAPQPTKKPEKDPRKISGLEKTQLASDTKETAAAPPKAAPLDATQASAGAPAPIPEAPAPAAPEAAPAQDRPKRNSKRAEAPPEGKPDGASLAEANLGAHSPTNFYKGLSGNDVIDDGGLFVATYEIPTIGTKLWITVNMPGGYEFQAVAVVRWTRESGAGDAPPGFGCAFVSISQDARQLVYRYVRNREPLFHDDF